MILYLDTSILLKLFVEEAGTGEVTDQVQSAEIVSTSVIAYAEAHSAIARRHREGALTKGELVTLLDRFRETWPQLLLVALSAQIYLRAGPLAVKYALRGMDAVHLSSYVELLGGSRTVDFLSHDDRLMAAAAKQRRGDQRHS